MHELAQRLRLRTQQDLKMQLQATLASRKIQVFWRRRRAAYIFTTKGYRFTKALSLDIVKDIAWNELTRKLQSRYLLVLTKNLIDAVAISLGHRRRRVPTIKTKLLLSAYVMIAEQETGDATPTAEPGTPKAEEDGAVAVPALLLILAFEKMLRPRAGTPTCCPSTCQLDEFVGAYQNYERAFAAWQVNDKQELTDMLHRKLRELDETIQAVTASTSRATTGGSTFSASPTLKGQPLYQGQQRAAVVAQLESDRAEIIRHLLRFGGEEAREIIAAGMEPLTLDLNTSDITTDQEVQPSHAAVIPASPRMPPPGVKEVMAHNMMLEKLPSNEIEELQQRISDQMKTAFWDQLLTQLKAGNTAGAASIFAELSVSLKSLTPSRQDLHAEIDHLLDVDLVSSQLRHGAMTVAHLHALAMAAASHIKTLEAPQHNPSTDAFCAEVSRMLAADAAEATSTQANAKLPPVPSPATILFVLKTLMDKCEEIKSGVLLFTTESQAMPALSEHGAVYERSAFNRRLASSGLSPRTLKTHAWLWRHLDRQQPCAASHVAGAVDAAILSLVTGSGCGSGDFPEVLEMDRDRITYLHREFQMATLAATASALATEALRSCSTCAPSSTMMTTSEWMGNFKALVLDGLRGGQLTVDQIALKLIDCISEQASRSCSRPGDDWGGDDDAPVAATAAAASLERFRSVFGAAVIAMIKTKGSPTHGAGRGGQEDKEEAGRSCPVLLSVIQTRCTEELAMALTSGSPVRPTSEVRFPVSVVRPELENVARRLIQMVLLTKAVHLPLFQQIASEP